MQRRNRGILAGLLASLFFSTYFVLGKVLVERLDPALLLVLSQGLAATALLLLFGLLPEIKTLKRLPPSSRIALFSLALIAGVAGPLLVMKGLQHTSAVNAVILGRIEPVAAGALSVFLLKEKIGRSQLFGGILMLLGILWIMTQGFSLGLHFFQGDILVVAGALCWSFSVPLFKRYLARLHPQLVVLVRNLVGATVLLLILPFTLKVGQNLNESLDLQAFSLLILFSLFTIITSQFLWYRSLELIPGHLASAISLLTPFFGVALAISVLGEPIYSYHAWGGILVLLGLGATIAHRHPQSQMPVSFWSRLRYRFMQKMLG